ncbi:shikimate kinase [Caloramator fervidus]|uniref:Shikimate kinase n=1 Tax=Caloramator fervidus TaxID=29344 RepID=A0A1H5V3C9_9CLOT|nr:shikimate kinase [Caloramator fervidus]
MIIVALLMIKLQLMNRGEAVIKNFSLIGMPGCGKTTIGKILSQKLGMDFIDLDEFIQLKIGLSISNIFDIYGEKFFRNIESECLKEVLEKEGQIIATGGGIVTVEKNIEILRNRSIVFYIKRNIEDILKNVDLENRPLLRDNKNKIYELYNQRYKLYEKCAHYVVDNKLIDEVVKSIINIIKNQEV